MLTKYAFTLDCSEPPLQLGWSHMTSSYQWTLNGSDELLGKDNKKPVYLIHFISFPLAEFVDVETVEHRDGRSTQKLMKMYKIFLGLGSELVISTFMSLAKAKWQGQAKSQGDEEMHSTGGKARNLG